MKNDKELDGLAVAVLVHDLFEQAELEQPVEALRAAGVKVDIVSPCGPQVQGLNHDEKGDRFEVDVDLARAKPEDYDALVLPGGTFNADALRTVEAAQRFVQAFEAARKPIAAVCHAPWLLVSAGLVPGRTLTSWPSLQDDLRNAGAHWVDREVVVDTNWITSRKPDDLPAFNRELIAALARAPLPGPEPMPISG